MVDNRSERASDTDPVDAAREERSADRETPSDFDEVVDPANRRRHDRLDVRIRGVVARELGPEMSEMLMSNLSLGGCFIRCTSPEKPGSLVMVRFALPDSDGMTPAIKAVGRVAWIRRGDAGGMGIQFVRVDDRDLDLLHRYIAGVLDEPTMDDTLPRTADEPTSDRRAA